LGLVWQRDVGTPTEIGVVFVDGVADWESGWTAIGVYEAQAHRIVLAFGANSAYPHYSLTLLTAFAAHAAAQEAMRAAQCHRAGGPAYFERPKAGDPGYHAHPIEVEAHTESISPSDRAPVVSSALSQF
jgi:hypothetical protein